MKSRRRVGPLFAVALGAAAVLAACGSTATTTGSNGSDGPGTSAVTPLGSTPGAPIGGAVEIKIVNSPYGKALGRGNGKVLYTWDKEADAGDGQAQCVSPACVEKWPPFTATALTFGDNVDKAKFSLVDRPDGSKQVAIDGRRLYLMALDAPGEANCQGSEGWWILNPDGTKNTSTSLAGSNGTVPGGAAGGPTTTVFDANTTTTAKPTTTTAKTSTTAAAKPGY